MSIALSSSTTARTVLLLSSRFGSTASRRRRFKRLHNGVIGTENAKGQLAEWSGLVHEHSSQVNIMLDTTCIYTGCCDPSPACRISHDNDTTKFTFSLHKLYFDLFLLRLDGEEEERAHRGYILHSSQPSHCIFAAICSPLMQPRHLCRRQSTILLSLYRLPLIAM